MTLLSTEVEGTFPLPAASWAAPAGIAAVTLPPVPLIPVTLTVKVLPSREDTATVFVPPEVPPIATSLPLKPVTASLNVAVKLIGGFTVGSA